ncbi:MAG: OprO/OprP family phosphate-selective porin, partial [Opitutales bacterium]
MRTSFLPSTAAALLAAILALPLLPGPRARANETDELKQLRDQISQLEQKLQELERKQAGRDEAAAAAAASAPRITISDFGFTLASADRANVVKLRGHVQLDSRLFFGDQGVTNNAFVLRRARLISEGTFSKNYDFQLVTEFAGSSVSIFDANFTARLLPGLQVKFGKFKTPVGLEQLQPDSWTFFNERALPTNLVPNRDLGIQVGGDLLDGRLNYAVGVLNGVPDGANSTNTDFDNDKDVVARVMVAPFRKDPASALQGLSFGVAGNAGREKTASGRTAGYKTDGQQTFFAYNAAVIADGINWRVSPQLDYRRGPFGLLGEYVVSSVSVRPNVTGARTGLLNKARQVTVGCVLTGENSSYNGVVPATDFNLPAGTWGAWEITARVADLRV